MVFEPVAPQFEQRAMAQVLAQSRNRHSFLHRTRRPSNVGRDEFRPVINGITIAYKYSLYSLHPDLAWRRRCHETSCWFPSMNESARSACGSVGARKWHIKTQFLAETLLIMLLGGSDWNRGVYVLPQPRHLAVMGPLFEDDSGKADIHLKISLSR